MLLRASNAEPFVKPRWFQSDEQHPPKECGLGWNQLPETGGVVVGDQVKLSIDGPICDESQLTRDPREDQRA